MALKPENCKFWTYAFSLDPSIIIWNITIVYSHQQKYSASYFSFEKNTLTYFTAHSPTLPSLYLRHSSFSKLSVTSPTSQPIFQPFRRFIYVTAHSPTLPLLHLRHSSFSNPSIASSTSQVLHLHHLASCYARVRGRLAHARATC